MVVKNDLAPAPESVPELASESPDLAPAPESPESPDLANDKSIFLPSEIGGELVLFSGAPLCKKDDALLGLIVNQAKGTKIVMGGTTAKIIARQMGVDIDVDLKPDRSGLPPISHVERIDRVSEGVLTLTAVRDFLKCFNSGVIDGDGIKFDIARLLLSHTKITVVEGTQINKEHLKLPVKLEKRSVLINQICEMLEDKFGKKIKRIKI